MKAWALEYQGNEYEPNRLFWTGNDLEFGSDIAKTVCFARREDAVRALQGMPLLRAKPVEVEVEGVGVK